MSESARPVLPPQTVVVRVATQVSAELADEVVILDLHHGVYYGLDGVGKLIWQSLEDAATFAELCDLVVATYEVAPHTAASDLAALLHELAQAGLVRLEHP